MIDVLKKIYGYQDAMGFKLDSMSYEDKLQSVRNYAVALMMEQAEMLEELPWKPWRTIESQKPNVNNRKVAMEWVDCFFFLVGQARFLGLTPGAIMDAFEIKLAANHNRITSGYSKIQQFEKGENAT